MKTSGLQMPTTAMDPAWGTGTPLYMNVFPALRFCAFYINESQKFNKQNE